MKISEQNTYKLALDHSNKLSKVVFMLLIACGAIMLVFYFTQEIEPLLWIGLLILAAGLVGYPFVKSIHLSLDKNEKQIVIAKSSLLGKENRQFNYHDVDSFTLKRVVSDGTSGEYGTGTTEHFYIVLTEKNGKSENIFVGNSKTKMQEKLNLIQHYFTKSII